MQFKYSFFAPALLAVLFAGPVWADEDELEITMEVMEGSDDFHGNEMTLDIEEEEAPPTRSGFLGGFFGGDTVADVRDESDLRERNDVQNIDLMNLSGFCRNCPSKWYRAAAEDRGIEMSYDTARERVYGMPYDEWKSKHQTEATPEQRAAYEATHGKST